MNASPNSFASPKDPRLAKQMMSNPSAMSSGMRCEPLAYDVEALFYPRLRSLFTTSNSTSQPVVNQGKDDARSFVRNYLLLPSGQTAPEDDQTQEMRARNKRRDDAVFAAQMTEEERADKQAKLDQLDQQALARDLFRRTTWSYGQPSSQPTEPTTVSASHPATESEPRTNTNSSGSVEQLPDVIADLATYCRDRYSIRGDSPCRITTGLYFRKSGTSLEAPPSDVLNRFLLSFNEEEQYILSPYVLTKTNDSTSDRVSSGLPEQLVKVVHATTTDPDQLAVAVDRAGYAAIYNMGPASLARYRILVNKNPVSSHTSKMPTGPGIRSGKTRSRVRRARYERVTVVIDFYSSEALVQEADVASRGNRRSEPGSVDDGSLQSDFRN